MRKYLRLIIIMILILAIGCVVIVYLNSNYRYSKLLLNAITIENKSNVLEIVEKRPNCVNTRPTLAPDWWQSLMELSIVEYPLGEACLTGNVEIVEILIENGADVNLGVELTPLSITYFLKPPNWYDISIYLLENGASLDYQSHNSEENVLTDIVGHRPGNMTVKAGLENSVEVTMAFYYALENCDHSKINWMRVLQHSVTNDRIEIVKFLLDEGYCDINNTSVGMTALMFAARDSTPEMIKLLLSYGADKDYKTADGKTAYDYAIKYNRQENVLALQ